MDRLTKRNPDGTATRANYYIGDDAIREKLCRYEEQEAKAVKLLKELVDLADEEMDGDNFGYGLLNDRDPEGLWARILRLTKDTDGPQPTRPAYVDDTCTTTCDFQKDGKCTYEPWARDCCTGWSRRGPQAKP